MTINSNEDYQKALNKLSELEENHEKNKVEFDTLFNLIYEYEETSKEFQDFNSRFL